MSSGLSAGKDRRSRGLHGNYLHLGLPLLQNTAYSGDGSPGSHPSHENVHLAFRIPPDFLRRGFRVNFGVRGVFELLGHESLVAGHEFLGHPHGARHPFLSRGEDDFCAQGLENGPALQAHRLRHDEDAAVSPNGADKGKPNPGVSGGGFHHDPARLKKPAFLRVPDHGPGNPVFYAAQRVFRLELPKDLARKAFPNAGKPNQRSIANKVNRTFRYAHDRPLS